MHPETIESKVINLVNNEKNNPSNSKVYARLMLWKKFGKPFTNKELMPIKSIKVIENSKTVILNMLDGNQKQINF